MSDPANLDFDSIRSTLEFDPFAPIKTADEGAQDTVEGGEGKDPPPAPAPEPEPGTAPAPAPEPPAGGEPAPKSDMERLVAEQAETIRKLLETTKQAKPAEPAPEGQAPPKASEEFKQIYDLQIPNQILQALNGDDENTRGQAMNVIVSGVMNRLANDFAAQMQAMKAEILQHVQTAIPQYQQQARTAEEVKNDFYSTFPDLNKPALQDYIVTRMRTLAEAEQATTGRPFQWTAEFRDRVGTLIHAETGIPRGQQGLPPAAAPAAPAAPVRQPAKAPFGSGGGNGAASGGSQPSNEFSDVLF